MTKIVNDKKWNTTKIERSLKEIEQWCYFQFIVACYGWPFATTINVEYSKKLKIVLLRIDFLKHVFTSLTYACYNQRTSFPKMDSKRNFYVVQCLPFLESKQWVKYSVQRHWTENCTKEHRSFFPSFSSNFPKHLKYESELPNNIDSTKCPAPMPS